MERRRQSERRSSGPMMLFAMTLYYPHLNSSSPQRLSLSSSYFPNPALSDYQTRVLKKRKKRKRASCFPAPHEQFSPRCDQLSALAGHQQQSLRPATSNTNNRSQFPRPDPFVRTSTPLLLFGKASTPNQRNHHLPNHRVTTSPAQRSISRNRRHCRTRSTMITRNTISIRLWARSRK